MGNKNDTVFVCCFCGDSVEHDAVATLTLSLRDADDGCQTLYAHNACLSRVVHSSLPLDPDVAE